MYAKRLIPIIYLLICMGISGCRHDVVTPNPAQENAKIKRILIYAGLDPGSPAYINSEYEYDSLGRISRVTHPTYQDGILTGTGEYELYEYDFYNRLQTITNYNYNDTPGKGFVSTWQRNYDYTTEGIIQKVTTSYTGSQLSEYSIYQYKNNRLEKSENYTFGDRLDSYTVYEYKDSGELSKELIYSFDGSPLTYTIHAYSGGLNVSSDTYSNSKEHVHLRKISRTFDVNGNLDILQSEELVPWSSSMSYRMKYEYFE